jgi:hypothetical protein
MLYELESGEPGSFLTHGDPASAMWNLVNVAEDSVGHAPSKKGSCGQMNKECLGVQP